MTQAHRLVPALDALRLPPNFLAPVLARSSSPFAPAIRPFSTSTSRERRFKHERNKQRGVSAMRRTGPKFPLSVSREPLPVPVLDPAKRTKLEAHPDHALWEFFSKERKGLDTPEEVAAHGRAWAVEELRHKSWEDLHSLWWVCCKEKNKIATQEHERRRLKAGYGEHEAETRGETVRHTQRAIKHVLTERWYAYENAQKELKKNPQLLERAQDHFQYLEPETMEDARPMMQAERSETGPAVISEPPPDNDTKQEQPRA